MTGGGSMTGESTAGGRSLDPLVQSHVQLLRLSSQRPFDQALAHRVRTLLAQAVEAQAAPGLPPEHRDLLARMRAHWESYLQQNEP